jgi:hypothetical protein
MFYHTVSQENMHDANGKPISGDEFKELVSSFYDAYPVVMGHSVEVNDIVINGDHSTAQANINWRAIPKDEKTVVRHEGSSEFKLTRSIYGGWDIIQASIPGWALYKEK